MPSAIPALVIDPVSRIASSSRIFPGPIARSSLRSTRKVSRAAATLWLLYRLLLGYLLRPECGRSSTKPTFTGLRRREAGNHRYGDLQHRLRADLPTKQMALASVESREMPVQALRHDAVTRTPENNSGGLWAPLPLFGDPRSDDRRSR